MAKVFEVIRLAAAVYRADPRDIERYENFQSHLRTKNAGQTLTERYFRETYDQWRRTIIKDEAKKTVAKEALALFLQDRERQISGTAILLVVMALLFPPFTLQAGSQSVYLGFCLAFNRQVGTVDGLHLACEIFGIVAMYWLARRFFASVPNEVPDPPTA